MVFDSVISSTRDNVRSDHPPTAPADRHLVFELPDLHVALSLYANVFDGVMHLQVEGQVFAEPSSEWEVLVGDTARPDATAKTDAGGAFSLSVTPSRPLAIALRQGSDVLQLGMIGGSPNA